MSSVRPVWADLDRAWERQLTVDLLAEPLASVPQDADPKAVAATMDERRWSVMGVSAGTGQLLAGYVHRADLVEGTLALHARAFTVESLIAGSAPIRDALSRIAEGEHLFVLGPKGVGSIVTTADLGKPPVRLVIFATVSMLEMVMGDVIRREFDRDGWHTFLTPKRLGDARKLQEERIRQDQELDLVACLQLCDKATVIGSSTELQALLGFESKRKCHRFFVAFQKLRDNVAHAHELGRKPSWREIAALIKQAEGVLAALSRHLEGKAVRDAVE